MIIIIFFLESKLTPLVKNRDKSYALDKHFYFEKSNLTTKQLCCSKILVEVYDSLNTLNRKDYFDIIEYNL